MNRHSLFKLQSLVAMILCTSVVALGQVTNPARPASPSVPAAVADRPTTPRETPATSATDDSTQSPGTRATLAASSSATDFAEYICAGMKTPKSDCVSRMTVMADNLKGSGDPQTQACSLARDNDTSKNSEANSKQEAYFAVLDQQNDMLFESAQTKEEANAAVNAAKIKYDTTINSMAITKPIQEMGLRNKAAKELLQLKNGMIDIGNEIMAIEDEYRAAEMAVTDAAAETTATCTTFAGTKANAKLKEFDDAFKAQKGAAATYINYEATSLSGAKNRRNAKRARDAQAAYMSAYSACMSGATDPNGGDAGPGPDLARKAKQVAQLLEAAKVRRLNKLQLVEQKKANLKEQMAQVEIGLDTDLKGLVAQQQVQANAALAEYTLAQNEATKSLRLSDLKMNIKGGFINGKAEMLKGQAATAAQAAQQANMTAVMKCGDAGAPVMQAQWAKQQQMIQMGGDVRRSAFGGKR